ncbi:unnamed protein product [Arctia plantaginis]|uniref:Uncharacterized protein n=1 Tax=Arctia plantaginis TaxID=874455 RepID=A0A8S1AIL4_ARCPL|nr:unnamed protein product [Arctia plantaginis]
MDSDKVTFRAVAVQILATFSIAFLTSLSGLLYSWPSYNVANFVSNETVLAEPMDSVQISLLGSVMNIGTFFLTPLVGWVMNKIGRKYTMICTGLPFVEAAESLAFYRQTSPTSKQVEMELCRIKLQLDSTPDKAVDEGGDPTVTKELLDIPKQTNLSEWQFLRQSPSSTRAFITSLIVMAIMVLMGNVPLQVYAENVFREAVPSSDANKCSVWLAVDYVAATVMCSLVIDRLGRKVRSFCCSFTMSTGFGLNFICTVITSLVMENYGFAPLFYGFSIIGFAGALFALFYLPETKGLTVEAIQMLFLKKNRQKIES